MMMSREVLGNVFVEVSVLIYVDRREMCLNLGLFLKMGIFTHFDTKVGLKVGLMPITFGAHLWELTSNIKVHV